jgi:hypothetical protein
MCELGPSGSGCGQMEGSCEGGQMKGSCERDNKVLGSRSKETPLDYRITGFFGLFYRPVF